MENGDDQVIFHRPADFVGPEFYTRVLPKLVILNTPIPDSDQNVEAFRRIWENTKPRICADGGANQLYDLFKPPGKHNVEAQRKYVGSRDSYVSRLSFIRSVSGLEKPICVKLGFHFLSQEFTLLGIV